MSNVTNTIEYIGVDDKTIDLFESQYFVPNGISYNSYLINDEKITVMDTVDKRMSDEWFSNLDKALNGRTPDYLVVLHVEPDHAGNILKFTEQYPNTKLIGNAQTFSMLGQFFDIDLEGKTIVVKDGETVSLGEHELTFVMAPMIHWPEVMVAYEAKDKVLFSADAFGKFGALDSEEEWVNEARRYYINIVGKYGMQVQKLLKKVAELDIQKICPLHGPVLDNDLEYYLNKYNIWSSYEPEESGVLVAYASIHGNTANAAKKMADILKEKGAKKVVLRDLSRSDMAEVIAEAFRYDKMILASATYDGGIFPVMADFLAHLKAKTYQNRRVGFIENGSWGPMAAKVMRAEVEALKNIELCETTVTIKSSLKENNLEAMENLAGEILK